MWRQRGEERYRVAFDLADADLQHALAEAIEGHPALVPTDSDELADVVIADRDGPAGAPRLRTDGDALPADAGPNLIVSAAHLTAAGLRLHRSGPAEPPAAIALSPRERQVMTLMIEGAPNKVIARALAISDRTAKFHVAAILGKLRARNRAEAVAIALREGLVVL
jgi:DNA-binding NarL/FixJ family response regulator